MIPPPRGLFQRRRASSRRRRRRLRYYRQHAVNMSTFSLTNDRACIAFRPYGDDACTDMNSSIVLSMDMIAHVLPYDICTSCTTPTTPPPVVTACSAVFITTPTPPALEIPP